MRIKLSKIASFGDTENKFYFQTYDDHLAFGNLNNTSKGKEISLRFIKKQKIEIEYIQQNIHVPFAFFNSRDTEEEYKAKGLFSTAIPIDCPNVLISACELK